MRRWNVERIDAFTLHIFKFLHVAGVIGWIGGVVAFSLLSAHMAQEMNPALLEADERLTRLLGAALIDPSTGVARLAGIAMLVVSGLGAPLWVLWGFAAILLSVVLGATLLRRTAEQVSTLAVSAETSTADLGAVRRRWAAVWRRLEPSDGRIAVTV